MKPSVCAITAVSTKHEDINMPDMPALKSDVKSALPAAIYETYQGVEDTLRSATDNLLGQVIEHDDPAVKAALQANDFEKALDAAFPGFAEASLRRALSAPERHALACALPAISRLATFAEIEKALVYLFASYLNIGGATQATAQIWTSQLQRGCKPTVYALTAACEALPDRYSHPDLVKLTVELRKAERQLGLLHAIVVHREPDRAAAARNDKPATQGVEKTGRAARTRLPIAGHQSAN
jgi:hypothetical protein